MWANVQKAKTECLYLDIQSSLKLGLPLVFVFVFTSTVLFFARWLVWAGSLHQSSKHAKTDSPKLSPYCLLRTPENIFFNFQNGTLWMFSYVFIDWCLYLAPHLRTSRSNVSRPCNRSPGWCQGGRGIMEARLTLCPRWLLLRLTGLHLRANAMSEVFYFEIN